MSHGMDATPIEASDDTLATVKPAGNSGSVIYVLDPVANSRLESIDRNLETIATLLQLLIGGGVKI